MTGHEPVNDDDLRAYVAAHFTTEEAGEVCMQWVRNREATGQRFASAADAAGMYVLNSMGRMTR